MSLLSWFSNTRTEQCWFASGPDSVFMGGPKPVFVGGLESVFVSGPKTGFYDSPKPGFARRPPPPPTAQKHTRLRCRRNSCRAVGSARQAAQMPDARRAIAAQVCGGSKLLPARRFFFVALTQRRRLVPLLGTGREGPHRSSVAQAARDSFSGP
jgi:hypothetical protein